MKVAVGFALSAAVVSVAATLAASSTVAAEPKQCLRLTNSTAGIYSAIAFVVDKNSDLANLPLHDLLAPLDKELPWLSTCAASVDVLSVGLGLLSDPVASKCLSSLTSGSSSNSSFAILGEDDFFASLCLSMNTTIFPCVNDVLVEAIQKLISTGGDCCKELKKRLPELLGQDFQTFVKALMVRVGDLLCSIKSYADPVDGKIKNEMCGQALVHAVLQGQDLLDLTELLQIPDDQACPAMMGHNFTTTSGSSYKLFTNQEPLDSCFAPVNNLLTDLSKLPMVANTFVSPVFDAGKCLSGESIISMALDENGIIQGFVGALDRIIADMRLMAPGAVSQVFHAGFSDLMPDLGPMCFHLPNSVTGCDYSAAVAYAFSSDPPPRSSVKHAGESSSRRTVVASHFVAAFAVVASCLV